jgi:hypothetical protein
MDTYIIQMTVIYMKCGLKYLIRDVEGKNCIRRTKIFSGYIHNTDDSYLHEMQAKNI